MVVLAAMLAMGADPEPVLQTPTEAWEDVYLQSRNTSKVGIVVPWVGGAVTLAGVGLLAIGRGSGEVPLQMYAPAAIGAAGGSLLLAGGSSRQCHALKIMGIKRHCVLPLLTWTSLAVTAVSVPASPTMLAGFGVSYLLGVVSFADVETMHWRYWPESPTVSIRVMATADRHGVRGFALAGTF